MSSAISLVALASRGQSRGPEADEKITEQHHTKDDDCFYQQNFLIYPCHRRRHGVKFHINARITTERPWLCSDEATIVPCPQRYPITPSTTFYAPSQQPYFASNGINAKVSNVLKYRQTASTAYLR
jgi:hypothetical protein